MSVQSQQQTQQALPYPLATLYVGDLDESVTEAQLFEKFSTSGHVLSIRVCRDQITRHSLGYAYVNFQQQADAERALDTMNFDTINGRPMRIMWSQRDPALRKSGVGNVFIKNLDKSIDNKALYDTFSTFGNILSCKIMIDEHGNSKGYGFVHFETQEAADKAVQNVHNMLLNGKKVFVGPFMSKNDRLSVYGDLNLKYTNVFVKNFSDHLDDEKLKELFEKYGEITSAVVAKNADGSSKGFGFVNFQDTESAKKAVESLKDFKLGENLIFVCPFQKKSVRQKELKRQYEEKKREKYLQLEGVNLYVKNLDDKIDDNKLKEIFSQFGDITSAKVMIENGRSKGFGFVCYKSREDAARAVSEMRGRIVDSKPLYVALAQRKQERLTKLANDHKNRLAQIRTPTFAPNQLYFTSPFVASYMRPTTRLANPTSVQTSFNTYQMISQQSLASATAPANRYQSLTTNLARPHQTHSPSYTRNIPQTQQRQRQTANRQATINVPGQEPLSTNMLASAAPQEQKQLLGERIYPLVFSMFPDQAGKITGMLLEIDNAELIHMLDHHETLKEKAQEAFNVLMTHQSRLQQK